MGFVKDLIQYFEPRAFEGDSYGWLTNQLAHNSGSYILSVFIFSIIYLIDIICSLETTICSVNLATCIVLFFWVFWEIRHFIKSKDKRDFLEDLFFEISGVGLYYFVFSSIQKEAYLKFILLNLVITGVTAFLFSKRIKES